MAYIRDRTTLLANPGLRSSVRRDVHALYHHMRHLKRRHLDAGAALQKYIIRRYVTSTNGVLLQYPGSILPDNLQPHARPWYRKACRYPNRTVITEPYLDAAGAGYIVTIAHTIDVTQSPQSHHQPHHYHHHTQRSAAARSTVMAVVGIDVTLGIVYKLLQQSADICGVGDKDSIKCFLMDDNGYLIGHPSVLEPTRFVGVDRRQHQQQRLQPLPPLEHVTHKESYVANDILYHRQFVTKRVCDNLRTGMRQRYYQFNTTTAASRIVWTNVVHSERTKYQIVAVRGTNVFAGILNETTGDGGPAAAAFCPCSTVDRRCLNCARMEQTYCECPCECSMASVDNDVICDAQPLTNQSGATTDNVVHTDGGGGGDGGDDDNDDDAGVCAAAVNDLSLPASFFRRNGNDDVMLTDDMDVDADDDDSSMYDDDDVTRGGGRMTMAAVVDLLKPCTSISCDAFGNQFDCLGIVGCVWCQMDADARTRFTLPFCVAEPACYMGILGAVSPYGLAAAADDDDDDGGNYGRRSTIVDSMHGQTYSAIGPVAGAIVALCLVIGLAMYCYRQNVDALGGEHLYGDSAAEHNNCGVPMSRFDYDDIILPDDDCGGGGGGGGGPGAANLSGNRLECNRYRTALMSADGNNVCGVADVSPYRMNGGGYRRPTNGESDHGYSTMTPHEDSEHQCFALAEPLINNKKRLSVSDSMSIDTSISSPTTQQQLQEMGKPTMTTQLPFNGPAAAFEVSVSLAPLPHIENGKQSHTNNGMTMLMTMSPHHIQAPVTVHHPMEAL